LSTYPTINSSFHPMTHPLPADMAPISRLMSAAVVDQRFCDLLVRNPSAALVGGYNGEAFHFSEEDQRFISSIRANSLSDFAMQWVKYKEMLRSRTSMQFVHL